MATPKPQAVTLRTNIKRITSSIIGKIIDMGFNVYVTYSHTSKSRYLEFKPGKGKRYVLIRVSDHPSKRPWKFNFDVFTDKARSGALNYRELNRTLEIKYGNKKRKNVIKCNKKGDK